MNAPEINQRIGRWRIRRGPRAAMECRDHVADLIGSEHRSGHGDALLVVSELAANASEYGTSESFEVEADDDGSSLTLVVRNPAAERPPSQPWQMPDPDAPRGRGLAVVDRVARALEVGRDAGVVVVRAVVDLGPEPG